MFPRLLGKLIGMTLVVCLSLKFYKLPNCFPKSLHHFIFPPQYMKLPLFPHDCQHLVLSVFFITGILLGVKQYLIVVLICISMTNDLDYVCICLMTTHISSLVKCLFKSLAYFKKCVVSLFFKVRVLYVLYFGRKFFIRHVICKYFLQVCGLSFYSFNSGF